MNTLFEQYNNIAKPMQKSNEWFTPVQYVEAARKVMETIDLDPASCEVANRTIRAAKYYTKEEDGLAQEWYGNIWLNPPFSREGYKLPQLRWGEKLYAEYQCGRVEQAILLIMSTAKNTWFHNLWEQLNCLMCIARKRLHFSLPSGEKIELKDGIFFLYLGSNEQSFIDVFSQFGTVVRRVSPSKPKITPLTLWEVSA